jgi:Bacteriophage lambda head decoration protein D
MAILKESIHPLEFLMSESESGVSRDTITVASGAGNLLPGAVLGQITASGKYKLSAATGTDGSQVAVAILGYPVDATANDVQAMAITCIARVRQSCLQFHESVKDDQAAVKSKLSELAKVFIKPR